MTEHECCWLENDRMRLRAVEPEDLDVLYRIENDTRFWKHGVSLVPYSRYALREFIRESRQDIYADGQLRLMIEEKSDGRVCGCIDLFAFSAMHARAEVGVLVLPSEQCRGVASEALTLLKTYAFRFLQLHQLYAYVAERNLPAQRLFSSCGFVLSAVLPDWIRQEGCFESVGMWTLFSNENGKK